MTCGNQAALLQWTRPCIYVSTSVLMDMAVKTSGNFTRDAEGYIVIVTSHSIWYYIKKLLRLLLLLLKKQDCFTSILANAMYSITVSLLKCCTYSVFFHFHNNIIVLDLQYGIPVFKHLCINNIQFYSIYMLNVSSLFRPWPQRRSRPGKSGTCHRTGFRLGKQQGQQGNTCWI